MSRIETKISEIESELELAKPYRFSSDKVIVSKSKIEEYLDELKASTPDEIRRYQKIIDNKDKIIEDAKEQAETILNEAQVQTAELINQHEIMQRAYAQANMMLEQAKEQAQQILDAATNDANEIRMGAIQYTDDMLEKLQYIIEHSIKDNRDRYNSLMSGLENILGVVNNNRKELQTDVAQPEESVQEEAAQADESVVTTQEREALLGDTEVAEATIDVYDATKEQ